ncbi:MAG: DJ-1/PfpI family protein [Bacteroidota bacterium]
MKIAFIIFTGMTLLDFNGVYDPLTRLKSMGYIEDLTWDICAYTDSVQDSFGLTLLPEKVKNDLSEYDVIIIPGGMGTRTLMHDPDFIQWIQTGKDIPLKVSVCTGSLILGTAGFLEGTPATSNPAAYELLAPYCSEVIEERIVDRGAIITAGAVASSLDLGLYLVEKWEGPEAAKAIKEKMAYKN